MGIDRALVQGRWMDQRQMAPLAKFAGSSLSTTTYALFVPSTGRAMQPSPNITLDCRAYIPSPVTLLCYDGVSLEPFWGLTTSFPFNLLVNFTYTAQQAGQYQIYCTNNAGWLDAAAALYTATNGEEPKPHAAAAAAW
jgi:hypothetical protein